LFLIIYFSLFSISACKITKFTRNNGMFLQKNKKDGQKRLY